MVINMSQHFLLSAKARTLSLAKVMRLSDQEAYDTFRNIRWADTDGEPVCPRCGCLAAYEYHSRRIFKCKACEAQFSMTTATIFASRKLSIRDLLAAIAIFVNGAKGVSALQLSRDLDCQYKTAFVLAHKLREAIGAEMKTRTLSGHVEIDGAYFGGYVKPENVKVNAWTVAAPSISRASVALSSSCASAKAARCPSCFIAKMTPLRLLPSA